jgi:hypothetical protein
LKNTDLLQNQWRKRLSCPPEISTTDLFGWATVLTLIQEKTDKLSVLYQGRDCTCFALDDSPTRFRTFAEPMIHSSRNSEFNNISASLGRAFADMSASSEESDNASTRAARSILLDTLSKSLSRI